MSMILTSWTKPIYDGHEHFKISANFAMVKMSAEVRFQYYHFAIFSF